MMLPVMCANMIWSSGARFSSNDIVDESREGILSKAER